MSKITSSVKWPLAVGCVVSAMCSITCMYYIILMQKSANGIELAETINTFGLLAQRSLLLGVVVQLVIDIAKKKNA